HAAHRPRGRRHRRGRRAHHPTRRRGREDAEEGKARRMSARSETVGLLLTILDEAYEKAAWHGPNLKGSLRGVTPRAASFRPARKRHSIRELVLHAAYWKYAVRRRLFGGARGSFPLSGSNWFLREGTVSAADWKRERALLEEQHRRLRAAVARLRRAP